MRLFLSSQDLGNYPEVARKLAGKNNKSIFIKNAQDDLPPAERNFSTPTKKKMFEDAGFEFEEIDLRDYFGKPDILLNKLSNIGSLWSSGGNTFILRRAMQASGLDKILVKLLKEDKIMYGGWSAGAIIMTPDLHGSDRADRPRTVPEGYDRKVIWAGLNLVPFYIVPHYKADWFTVEADNMVEYFKDRKLPYRALKDGQAVIIDGDKEKLLK